MTTSFPVVTVTVCEPGVAVLSMNICAYTVWPTTFTALGCTPGPKSTEVVPCAKCVFCPVRMNDVIGRLHVAWSGLIDLIDARPPLAMGVTGLETPG